ncbi:MAG: SUMF1/EgtB/PvdO family nonheme iron enzyme, partial [Deltaproteobacteria bacterium]|nr:SUMF1/EgtB/PvdO family nonheme iron enzyme [Deltaproteobacteria bacterium]
MILVLLMIPFEFSSGADKAPGSESSGTAGGPDQVWNPSKLYESVSGYVDGLRGKTADKQQKRSDKPPEQHRNPDKMKKTDPEPLRILEREKALVRIRMQSQDWDLAVGAIERAIEAAENAGVTQDLDQFKQMLKEAKAKAEQEPRKTRGVLEEITNAAGMKLVAIPSGTFTMGSSQSERRRVQNEWNLPDSLIEPEVPSHSVRISKPFLIGKYEVTAGQFKRFLDETGYRTVAEGQGWGWVYDKNIKHWAKKQGASWRNPGTEVWEDHPVTMVCRADAEAFCTWLGKKDGRRYYLPTEAQWEYACRGGKEGLRFPWGNEYPDGRKLNFADMRSPVPW